jgi:hypothetical protein
MADLGIRKKCSGSICPVVQRLSTGHHGSKLKETGDHCEPRR